MKHRNRRKCLYCKEEFDVDVRNAKRQKCCRRPECRKAQKAERQAAWVAKNPGYFSGPENVARVQAWRAQNPGYWQRRGRKGQGRARRAGSRALQDAHIPQVIDPTADSGLLTPRASALQDALSAQDPILIGLIAHLTDSTLQDDIAATTRRLLQLGQDILRGTDSDACKASAAA